MVRESQGKHFYRHALMIIILWKTKKTENGRYIKSLEL